MTWESTNAPGMQTIPGNDWKHAVLSPQPQIRNCCDYLISKLTFFNNQMNSTSSQILQRDKVKLNYLLAQNKIEPSNEWIMISSEKRTRTVQVWIASSLSLVTENVKKLSCVVLIPWVHYLCLNENNMNNPGFSLNLCCDKGWFTW